MPMRELGRIGSYEDLIRVLRTRCDEFDIAYSTLDEIAGLSAGLSGQFLAPHSGRVMGCRSLVAILGALGITLIAQEDPEALARALPRMRKRQPNGAHRQPTVPVV
jgi:hypothetical protein